MNFTNRVILFFMTSSILNSQELDLNPIPYTPPKAPQYKGSLQQNNTLLLAELLFEGQINGPEDISIDSNGQMYISNENGIIYKSLPNGELEIFTETKGRPLGLKFDSKRNLIVCHESMGLISVDSNGEKTILVSKSQGFSLIDDLVISKDDIVYFSDATQLEGIDGFYNDILLHHPLGSVWSFNLNSTALTLIADSLYFPNGLELSEDESVLYINETPMYRTLQLSLTGENRGDIGIFADNLPGFPDGIDPSSDGGYWISMASPRKWLVDAVISPSAWLKKILMVAPEWMRPKPTLYGLIVKIDSNGNIVESLHNPSGEHLHTITNVVEFENHLYIGSLLNDCVGKLSLDN